MAMRIHFTGGPGSGKTTAAKLLAARLGVSHYDWDTVAIAFDKTLPRPLDPERLLGRMDEKVAEVIAEESWISDGSYLGWASPLFDAADLVVRMDVPWRVASYRILSRHIKADLARNNRFPGWRALYRFWRWSGRYYNDRNPSGLNIWGTPESRSTLLEFLQPYMHKTVVCRTSADVKALAHRLQNEPSRR
jgi:adenylate kinase family enzyme